MKFCKKSRCSQIFIRVRSSRPLFFAAMVERESKKDQGEKKKIPTCQQEKISYHSLRTPGPFFRRKFDAFFRNFATCSPAICGYSTKSFHVCQPQNLPSDKRIKKIQKVRTPVLQFTYSSPNAACWEVPQNAACWRGARRFVKFSSIQITSTSMFKFKTRHLVLGLKEKIKIKVKILGRKYQDMKRDNIRRRV